MDAFKEEVQDKALQLHAAGNIFPSQENDGIEENNEQHEVNDGGEVSIDYLVDALNQCDIAVEDPDNDPELDLLCLISWILDIAGKITPSKKFFFIVLWNFVNFIVSFQLQNQ